MKQKQFLLVYLVLLFYLFIPTNYLVAQQYDEEYSPFQPDIYTQTTNKNSTVEYTFTGSYHIGKDTTDNNYKWQINRSIYRFDISQMSSDAKILSVKGKYIVTDASSGHSKFKITDYQPNGWETDEQNWMNINNATDIKSNLSGKDQWFTYTSEVLTNRVKSAKSGNGIFYLCAESQNESAALSYANVDLKVQIKYEIVKLTVRNDMHGYHGGHIGVGINTSPILRNSPYITPVLSYGTSIKLYAYEDNYYGGYNYIWNDTEAPKNNSVWSKEDGEIGHQVPSNTSQTTAYSVVKKDGGAKLIARLKRVCNVTQKYEFVEGGTSGTIQSTTRIEGNTITFTADATKTANGLTGYFYGWKEDASTNLTLTKTINEHSTFTAQYKAIARSNNANAFALNNQRKILRTENGTMFRVYESLNKIWLEKSTDGGTTWVLANNHEPISYDTGGPTPAVASSPSIGIAPHNDVPNHFVMAVCYLLSTPSQDALWVVRIDANGNILTDYSGKFEKQIASWPELGEPVIAVNYNGEINIVFKRKNDILRSIVLNEGLVTLKNLEAIPNSDNSSSHPTISSDVLYFHLAWQQNVMGGSNIRYKRMKYENNQIYYSHQSDPSNSPDYDENMTPSITCFDQRATIGWVNIDEDWVVKRVHVRTKNSSGTWGTTTSLTNYTPSTDISVSVASLSDDMSENEYILGYAPDDEKVIYYLPEDNDEDYLYPNNYDDYVQVCNDEEGANAVFGTFKTNSSPYTLRTSLMWGNLSKESKKEKATKGRELIVKKSSTYLKIKINTPTVDGKRIAFVDIDDTTAITSKEEALSLFTTKEFELNSKSEFLFTLNYVGTNENEAKEGRNAEISLNVVLVDAKTNQKISVLKEVSNKTATEEDKEGVQYKVNTEGIGSREVKLLIDLDPKTVDDIVIVKTSNLKGDALKKDNTIEVSLDKDLIVTEYRLFQNYPNPFNPSTTISYQIPAKGKVTIKVYDTLGKEVAVLVDGYKERGRYNVMFDGSKLTSGIYFYSLVSGKYKATRKLILLK